MATIFSCSETSNTNDESLKLDTPNISIADLGKTGCPSPEYAIFDEFEDVKKNDTSRLQACHLSGNECIKKSILYVDDNIQHQRIQDVPKVPTIFSASSDEHGTYSVGDDAASDNEKTYSISETSDDEIAVKRYPDSFEESDSCRSLQRGCEVVADNVSKRVERCLSSVENIEESIRRRTEYEDVVGKIIGNYYNLYSKRLKVKGTTDGSSSDSSVSSVRSNSFSNSCCFETSSPDGSICREQTEPMSKLESFSCHDVRHSTSNQSNENNRKSSTNDSYRSSILGCWSGTSSRSSINEEETATTTSVYPKSNDAASSTSPSSTSNDDQSDGGFDNIILEPPEMFKTIGIKLQEDETCGDKYRMKVDLNGNITVNRYENQTKNTSTETRDDVSSSSDQSETSQCYKDDCNSIRVSTTVYDNLDTYETTANDREENERENRLPHAAAINDGRRPSAANAISSRENNELIDQHNNDNVDISSIDGQTTSRSTTTSNVDSSTRLQSIESDGSAVRASNSAENPSPVANIVDYDIHLPFIDEDISEFSSVGPISDEELRNFDPGGKEKRSDSIDTNRCSKNIDKSDAENEKFASGDHGWVPMVLKNIDNDLIGNPTEISAEKVVSKVITSAVDGDCMQSKISDTSHKVSNDITRCDKSANDVALCKNEPIVPDDRECHLESSKINDNDHRAVDEQVQAYASQCNAQSAILRNVENKEYTETENSTNDGIHSNDETREKCVENGNSEVNEKILPRKNDEDINDEVNAKKTSDHDRLSINRPDILNENSNSNNDSKTNVAEEFHSYVNDDQLLKNDEASLLHSDEKRLLRVSNLEAVRKFSDYFEKSLRMDSTLGEDNPNQNLNAHSGVRLDCSFNDETDDVQVTSFVGSSSDSDLSEDEQQTKDDNSTSIVSKDPPQFPSGILKSKFRQNFAAKSNRVRFDETLNEFFDADYVILIQDDDDDDEDDIEYDQCECDDQYCCDQCYYGEEEEEDEEDDNEEDDLNENSVDSPQFDFAVAFEPPVDFVDVVTLSPPAKYKDGCGDPDVIPKNKISDKRDEETLSKTDSKTENSKSIQSGAETAQKKETEVEIKSDVTCKNEDSTTLINGSEKSTDFTLDSTDPSPLDNNETPKAIERCIIFDSGVQLNYVEFTPPSHKSIGGILKGGKQWRSPDLRNESSSNNDSTQSSISNSMPKRIVKFDSDENSSTKNCITDEKCDNEPALDNDFTLTFTLGNLVVPCNSLKPNSAVRQLFPDPRYANPSVAQQSKLKDENLGKCEGKFLVTEESLRAFNEVNKRSVFATFSGKERYPGRDTEFAAHSDDEDLPQNNLIRKTIERNTLRRNRIQNARNIGRKRFDNRKKNSTEPSLEERIKQLTYDIGSEAVNGKERRCDSVLNHTNQPERESQQSQPEQGSFVMPIRTELKRTPSVQEARKQFLSSLACDSEISEHPGDRLSIISNVSTGTEYSVGDIDEALENPVKLNTDDGDGAIDSQDELVMFVMQDAGRIERIRRRYSSAPTSSPSPATSSSDEHDGFSFIRQPSICGFNQSYLNSPIMSRMNGGHMSPTDTTPTSRLDKSQQSFSNGPSPTNILAMQSYNNHFKQSSQSLHLPSPTFGVNGSVSSLPQLPNNAQNQYGNSFANGLTNGYSPPLARTNRYQPQLIHFNYTTAALAYQSLRASSMQLAVPNPLLERGTLKGVTNSSSPTLGRDYVKLSPMQLPRADTINHVQQGKPATIMYGMNV